MRYLAFFLLFLLSLSAPASPAGQKVSPIEVGNCPVSGDFVRGYTSAGLRTCGTPAASGDVFGPSSSINNDIVTFNGTTGKIIKDSGVAISSVLVAGGALFTLNAGSGVGLTTPGAISQGGTYTIGATTDQLQFGSLGLNVAAPSTAGQLSITGGANNLTLVTLKRNTDTSPTGNFEDFKNVAGSSLYTIDITGAVTTGTWNGSIINATYGGTSNGFTAFTGPTTSTKTFTLPNASATILTTNAAVTVAQGGIGITSGTSGGVLGFTGSTTLASSGVLTANMPVIGGGAGATPSVGTASGNTTQFVTTTGTQTSGRCVKIDANGNHVADSAACGTLSVSTGIAAISWTAGGKVNDAIVLTANSAMTITAIKARIIAAVGTTAAISIIKAASGTACTTGAGTNLIASSGTVDANTASTTNQSVTLAGSGAPSISAGDTVCLQTANDTNFAAGTGAGGITLEYTIP